MENVSKPADWSATDSQVWKPKRSAVVGWVLYDLANTIFSMAIVSLYFSLWVLDRVGQDRVDFVYGITTAISMLIIFLVSPMLGAMTDKAKRRMPFLVVSTLICVAFTALLGMGGLYITLTLFIIANIAYQAGIQFYDALLPDVSTEENRGWIGGLGVGVGYLGSYIGIGVGLLITAFYRLPVQMIFPVVAALFLLFSLPCFFFVREQPNTKAEPFSWKMVQRVTTQTFETIRNSKNYPGLGRFLLGRIFYTDAINTMISVMGLYVTNQVVRSGLSADDGAIRAQIILLGAVTFAIIGGLAWGKIVDKIGPKRSLTIVLILWMGIFLLAALIGLLNLPIELFYVVAALAGFALGGTWAADRPYMLRLTPPARIGEFYGLYSMVGRFSAITGPLLWGLVVGWMFAGNPNLGQPIGVLVLLVCIIIGFVILRSVSDAPRTWPEHER
jgi:UMF1 family MFS transporter